MTYIIYEYQISSEAIDDPIKTGKLPVIVCAEKALVGA